MEQIDLFTYQQETKPCSRWSRYDKCWNCPEFVNRCQKACGSCAECETPNGDYFVGCEYNGKVGKKIANEMLNLLK